MIRKLFRIVAWPALALLLLSPGCSSFKDHRNKDPLLIRHHTWWNYYQRGRQHLQQKNFPLAEQDFETALGIRKGARQAYPHDQWRVRTYGMHTMESYFPHRELGISLYYQNRYTEALPLLESSMQMEPSSRAKFYLNQVRRHLAIAAAPPPRIKVNHPETWTAARQMEITGSASGINAIEKLIVNGHPEFIELAKTETGFASTIDLVEGSNTVVISATDVSGKTTITNLQIIADFSPPEILLSRQGSKLLITCSDNLGLDSVILNGHQEVAVANEYLLSIDPEDYQTLNLSLADHAGNQLNWHLNKRELEHLVAQPGPESPSIQLAQAQQTITLYNTEYEFDIQVSDDTAIQTLRFNGKVLLDRPVPLFRTSRRIPLSIGTNPLELVAVDNEGNVSRQKVTIIRRQPEFLDSHHRLSALQSPVTGELEAPETGTRIDSLISSELSSIPPRFFMLASSSEEERIKDELNLSASEWSDPQNVLKAGRQLDAELVFRIRSVEDAPGRTIYTQVYGVDGNQELFTEDVYFENPAQLESSIEGLVMKIEQRFPLVKARLSRLERELAIDAGTEQGLLDGARFLVIQSRGEFNEGRMLNVDGHPVEVVASEIEPTRARVILDDNRIEGMIRDGDFVYSR